MSNTWTCVGVLFASRTSTPDKGLRLHTRFKNKDVVVLRILTFCLSFFTTGPLYPGLSGQGQSQDGSTGSTDDDGQDNSEELTDSDENQGDDGTGERSTKRVRTVKGDAMQDRYLTKSESFRAWKKDGEVQYELWVMAFVKINRNGSSQEVSAAQTNREETMERFTTSLIVQAFVVREVAEGRIGVNIQT